MSALAAAVAALAAVPGASATTVGPEYYGINAQVFSRLDPGLWEPHLSEIAASGVRLVRRDAIWGKVEPTPPVDGVHDYDWAGHDRFAAALARHGLRWYPTLAYGTTWASGVAGPEGWMTPPRDPADYAAFAAAFAARYGAGGSFWAAHPELPRLPVESYEVWNEPNVEKFFPEQSTAPERYADLYVAAAAAIRGADPRGRVLIGGLGSIGIRGFLARMAARRPGLWSLVDAVSYHPFGGHVDLTFERIAAVRSALTELGAGQLPLEITETGWASPPSSEAHRAEQMRRLTEDLPRSNCGVTRFIPYTWNTPEATDDPEDWFGIANADGSLKPSGLAYVAATRRMRGALGAPPRGTIERCHPGVSLHGSVGDLTLRVRPRRLRPGASRLRVSLTCSSSCRVALSLVARRRGGRRTVTLGRTRARLASRAKVVALRVPTRRLRRVNSRTVTLRARASSRRGSRDRVARRIVVRR